MDDVILKIDHGAFSYGGTKNILEDVSLEIKKGEAIALLGSNGSGKTTIQKIIGGLLFVTKGSYIAFGQKITEKAMSNNKWSAQFRKQLGILFQNSDVQLFCADVRSEILFGVRLLGLPEEECQRRTAEVLTMFDIKHLADEPPHYLSGGQKKKVALAAIMATNPEVLILDEPTNGLDPRSVRWLVKVLQIFRDRGKTIIFSTHHLNIVDKIATRSILFGEDHKILYDGEVAPLLNDTEILRKANLI